MTSNLYTVLACVLLQWKSLPHMPRRCWTQSQHDVDSYEFAFLNGAISLNKNFFFFFFSFLASLVDAVLTHTVPILLLIYSGSNVLKRQDKEYAR